MLFSAFTAPFPFFFPPLLSARKMNAAQVRHEIALPTPFLPSSFVRWSGLQGKSHGEPIPSSSSFFFFFSVVGIKAMRQRGYSVIFSLPLFPPNFSSHVKVANHRSLLSLFFLTLTRSMEREYAFILFSLIEGWATRMRRALFSFFFFPQGGYEMRTFSPLFPPPLRDLPLKCRCVFFFLPLREDRKK